MTDRLAAMLDELAEDLMATEQVHPDQPAATRAHSADARLDYWEEALTKIDASALRRARTDSD